MLIFASPETALRAGYIIVDYDVERQVYIVEKDRKRSTLRSKRNGFAAILPS